MTAGADGATKFEIKDDHVMIYGKNSVFGRSFVVPTDVNDLGDGGHELSTIIGKVVFQDLRELLRDLEHQDE